jgi:chromosome segregation ATPase
MYFNFLVDKRDAQISEMEDLIAQLNTDKNYFEKELIEMQIKQSDLVDELKRKDKEIYELQKRNEGVDITIESHLSRIQDLEDGNYFLQIEYFVTLIC